MNVSSHIRTRTPKAPKAERSKKKSSSRQAPKPKSLAVPPKAIPRRQLMGGSVETVDGSIIETEDAKLLEASKTYNGIKWKKMGFEGSQYLEFYLKKDQEIIIDKHSLVYMMDGIERESKMNGFFKGLARKVAGEYAFMTHLKGVSDRPRKLVVSLPIPGDIVHLRLKKGEEWKLSKYTLLACTANVEISATFNIRGVLSDEGIALTALKAVNGDADVWLCAFGYAERHDVPVGDDLYIMSGNFLAAPISAPYRLAKVNTILGKLSGADLLAIHFTGPCVVYTHSVNGIYSGYYRGHFSFLPSFIDNNHGIQLDEHNLLNHELPHMAVNAPGVHIRI